MQCLGVRMCFTFRETEKDMTLVYFKDFFISILCINALTYCTFIFIHLAEAFIQSNLQLLYMSEVARLWSN